MTSIKIKQMRDVLIVDKVDGNEFIKGANIFCGCCGQPIGQMKKKMTMPFKAWDFLDALKNKSVEWMKLGLRHKPCRHTMFPFQNHFTFMRLSDYQK